MLENALACERQNISPYHWWRLKPDAFQSQLTSAFPDKSESKATTGHTTERQPDIIQVNHAKRCSILTGVGHVSGEVESPAVMRPPMPSPRLTPKSLLEANKPSA